MNSFGTMRDFAHSNNYAHSYYKRVAQGKALVVLGRTQARQGRPALRCTEDFVAAARRHAAVTCEYWDTFTVGQDLQIVDSYGFNQKVDFVRFEIIDTVTFCATGYQIGGGYWSIDSQIIGFGVGDAE